MKIMSKWLKLMLFGFTPIMWFADPADPAPAEPAPAEPAEPAPPADRKSALADGDEPPAEGDEPPAEGDEPAEPAPPAEVNYAEIELPDGIKLDEKALEHFTPELQALNVNSEQAKELFTKFAAYQNQQIEAANTQFNTEWDADQAEIAKIPKEDLAAAKKARDAFFDEKGIELLGGRLGDVPAVVQALVKIGKAMAEDKFVEGEGTSPAKKAEEILYPSMKK